MNLALSCARLASVAEQLKSSVGLFRLIEIEPVLLTTRDLVHVPEILPAPGHVLQSQVGKHQVPVERLRQVGKTAPEHRQGDEVVTLGAEQSVAEETTRSLLQGWDCAGISVAGIEHTELRITNYC